MKCKQFRSPANKHRRFGSRHTRRMSKLGVRPTGGQHLDVLLSQEGNDAKR